MPGPTKRPDLPYVDAFILDRWDQLTPALHQLFIGHNAAAAARVESLQGKPKFDREREKSRARFARNLTKWRNTDGRKLPSGEAGISQHMAMVTEYETHHGRISDIDRATHKKTYATIRRQAEIEVEHESQLAALLKRGSWLIGRRARSIPGEWCPRWSKEPLAPYRELQNIPAHWEMSKSCWHGDTENLDFFGYSACYHKAIMQSPYWNLQIPETYRSSLPLAMTAGILPLLANSMAKQRDFKHKEQRCQV